MAHRACLQRGARLLDLINRGLVPCAEVRLLQWLG
jgi:hypothetical protein